MLTVSSHTPKTQPDADRDEHASKPQKPNAALFQPASWADLPPEIVCEVNAWLALEGRSDDMYALACTSKKNYDIHAQFLQSPVYRDILSAAKHKRSCDLAASAVRYYANPPFGRLPHDATELSNLLVELASAPEDDAGALYLSKDRHEDITEGDWLAGFRNYTGASLTLGIVPNPWERGKGGEIAAALPPETFLRLRLYKEGSLMETAQLVERIAASGRMTGFEFWGAANLVRDAKALGIVMDALCKYPVNEIRFEGVRSTALLMKELVSRCADLQWVRLIAIDCYTPPDAADINALSKALQERQRQGLSRVTVAINDARIPHCGVGSIFFPKYKDRAVLESAGIYCRWMPATYFHYDFPNKLQFSVRQGPRGRWTGSAGKAGSGNEGGQAIADGQPG